MQNHKLSSKALNPKPTPSPPGLLPVLSESLGKLWNSFGFFLRPEPKYIVSFIVTLLMKWLSHAEGWQSCSPARWGLLATCSVQAMDGKVGMIGLVGTWAPFLICSPIVSGHLHSWSTSGLLSANCQGSAVGISLVCRYG